SGCAPPLRGAWGTAGGEPRHEYAGRIHIVGGDNLLSDAGNDGWLARASYLVLRHETIPTQRCVCRLGLGRIGDEKTMLLSEIIHSRSSRKVVSILRTAMQHHDQ